MFSVRSQTELDLLTFVPMVDNSSQMILMFSSGSRTQQGINSPKIKNIFQLQFIRLSQPRQQGVKKLDNKKPHISQNKSKARIKINKVRTLKRKDVVW